MLWSVQVGKKTTAIHYGYNVMECQVGKKTTAIYYGYNVMECLGREENNSL